MSRGGSRPGAGRPKKDIPDSKTVRVPYAFGSRSAIEQLIALRDLVYDYKALSEDESPTSPRYEKLREFLADAESLCPSILTNHI